MVDSTGEAFWLIGCYWDARLGLCVAPHSKPLPSAGGLGALALLPGSKLIWGHKAALHSGPRVSVVLQQEQNRHPDREREGRARSKVNASKGGPAAGGRSMQPMPASFGRMKLAAAKHAATPATSAVSAEALLIPAAGLAPAPDSADSRHSPCGIGTARPAGICGAASWPGTAPASLPDSRLHGTVVRRCACCASGGPYLPARHCRWLPDAGLPAIALQSAASASPQPQCLLRQATEGAQTAQPQPQRPSLQQFSPQLRQRKSAVGVVHPAAVRVDS